MSYFNILSQTMSTMFVRGISEIAEALVAIKRLQLFLLNDEFVALKALTNNNDSKTNFDNAINLHKTISKWSPNSTDNALNEISVSVGKDKLLGVIGPVGSGKSSLLQTILGIAQTVLVSRISSNFLIEFLGELHIAGGNIEVNGTVSYASQEAWVFASSIRQNIIFGQEYNKKRYNEVVRVCALEKDFKQFPDGDLSIVGDRGASLSGGQKARINLARAVYRDVDIYLLDDPLSAVDTHVAKHLYQECINGYLKNKARILVTHQVHHLKDADNIIIMRNVSTIACCVSKI